MVVRGGERCLAANLTLDLRATDLLRGTSLIRNVRLSEPEILSNEEEESCGGQAAECIRRCTVRLVRGAKNMIVTGRCVDVAH